MIRKLIPSIAVLGAAMILTAASYATRPAGLGDRTVVAAFDAPSTAETARSQAFERAMRKLWADHVIWTREYIVAAVDGDPGADAAAARLLRNQEEIGQAIAPYYGNPAGAKLTDLLKQHILIAVDLVAAAKAGDAAKQSAADKRWHDNAADIATFLSGANPNWKKDEMLAMLNDHLALTTQEAVARLQKKWGDDVAAFDKIFTQAMMMADGLSSGIVRQFPRRFS